MATLKRNLIGRVLGYVKIAKWPLCRCERRNSDVDTHSRRDGSVSTTVVGLEGGWIRGFEFL